MLVIENTSARMIGFGGVVTLKPGENRVKEDDWNKILETDPTVEHYLKNEEVVVVDQISQEDDEGQPPQPGSVFRSLGAPTGSPPPADASGGEATPEPGPVPGNAESARLTVEGNSDVAQLESWAAAEDRSSVKKAIDKRLSELRG
jgi:hypothetical protein